MSEMRGRAEWSLNGNTDFVEMDALMLKGGDDWADISLTDIIADAIGFGGEELDLDPFYRDEYEVVLDNLCNAAVDVEPQVTNEETGFPRVAGASKAIAIHNRLHATFLKLLI